MKLNSGTPQQLTTTTVQETLKTSVIYDAQSRLKAYLTKNSNRVVTTKHIRRQTQDRTWYDRNTYQLQSLSECLFFFGTIFSAMERAQAPHVDNPVSALRMRPLSDNIKANDDTTNMNDEGESNCPLQSKAMADSFTNEDQPRTTEAVDWTNSDYGHDDGGGRNAQHSHAHDEQVLSQAITDTKRDKNAKQTPPNSAADNQYYTGNDDTDEQSNVPTANNKGHQRQPTTAAITLHAHTGDAARSNAEAARAERANRADVKPKVQNDTATDKAYVQTTAATTAATTDPDWVYERHNTSTDNNYVAVEHAAQPLKHDPRHVALMAEYGVDPSNLESLPVGFKYNQYCSEGEHPRSGHAETQTPTRCGI